MSARHYRYRCWMLEMQASRLRSDNGLAICPHLKRNVGRGHWDWRRPFREFTNLTGKISENL